MKIVLIDNTKSDRLLWLRDTLGSIISSSAFLEGSYVQSYKHVWGDEEEGGSSGYAEPGDVNFIHANDNVNPGWLDFLKAKCKGRITVCYSGGGLRGLNESDPKHYAFSGRISSLNDVKEGWDLRAFLEAIVKSKRTPFDFLNRVDPILEAKLLLLYELLEPRYDVVKLHALWEKYENDLEESESFDSYRRAWERFLELLAKMDPMKPAAKSYLGELELLRNSLLD